MSLRERARARVAQGFDRQDEIVASLLDELRDEPVDPRDVEAAVAEAMAAHRAAQAEWPIPTDCDRLDRAFAQLEASGIVARQNWTCCQTCGHAEMGDELDERAQGYVFFHMQDTESAVEGDGLYLAYGSIAPGQAAARSVARRVIRALQREGLSPEWNDSAQTRIRVPLDWKKRRA
jgi:hypothetical protein